LRAGVPPGTEAPRFLRRLAEVARLLGGKGREPVYEERLHGAAEDEADPRFKGNKPSLSTADYGVQTADFGAGSSVGVDPREVRTRFDAARRALFRGAGAGLGEGPRQRERRERDYRSSRTRRRRRTSRPWAGRCRRSSGSPSSRRATRRPSPRGRSDPARGASRPGRTRGPGRTCPRMWQMTERATPGSSDARDLQCLEIHEGPAMVLSP